MCFEELVGLRIGVRETKNRAIADLKNEIMGRKLWKQEAKKKVDWLDRGAIYHITCRKQRKFLCLEPRYFIATA